MITSDGVASTALWLAFFQRMMILCSVVGFKS